MMLGSNILPLFRTNVTISLPAGYLLDFDPGRETPVSDGETLMTLNNWAPGYSGYLTANITDGAIRYFSNAGNGKPCVDIENNARYTGTYNDGNLPDIDPTRVGGDGLTLFAVCQPLGLASPTYYFPAIAQQPTTTSWTSVRAFLQGGNFTDSTSYTISPYFGNGVFNPSGTGVTFTVEDSAKIAVIAASKYVTSGNARVTRYNNDSITTDPYNTSISIQSTGSIIIGNPVNWSSFGKLRVQRAIWYSRVLTAEEQLAVISYLLATYPPAVVPWSGLSWGIIAAGRVANSTSLSNITHHLAYSTDTWSLRITYPTTSYGKSSYRLDGSTDAVWTGRGALSATSSSFTNTHYRYNNSTRNYTTLTVIPGSSRYFSMSGGIDSDNGAMTGGYASTSRYSDHYSYNISTLGWTTQSTTPTNCMHGTGFNISSGVYGILYGYVYISSYVLTQRDWHYTLSSNTCTTNTNAPSPARTNPFVARLQSYIHSIGGNDGTAYMTNHERKNISTGSWDTRLASPIGRGGATVTLPWGNEEGIYSSHALIQGSATLANRTDKYTALTDSWASVTQNPDSQRYSGSGASA